MKKFLLICLGIFTSIFIIAMIVAVFDAPNNVNESIKNRITTETIDSVKIKKEQRIKDSILTITQKNRETAEKKLKSFKKKVDEFKKTTFYSDPRAPGYTNVNFIYPYIGENSGQYYLRLKLQYAADDWLFIKNGILLIDEEQYPITGTWERDNDSGIWEWLDMPVGNSELVILDKLANSKIAKVRYEGTQYHDDRTITNKEKDIIKKTLDIYKNIK